ncbi:hypothetical protein TK90_2883 (plasmid) [Thioalkalivibrio sp. K90mix]|uniref:hypothetical protein n=1 Tax=Thioalkalivibrio sp. (strain K90mix) TaxID=396595 RepID=UPI000195A953|nr:hypothetical protein [Thioalkalivibrio sp. K90mix]ADC73367.1 hypothetical protein TK90_2883 [Thioalkalivibrio sp. K90mix]
MMGGVMTMGMGLRDGVERGGQTEKAWKPAEGSLDLGVGRSGVLKEHLVREFADLPSFGTDTLEYRVFDLEEDRSFRVVHLRTKNRVVRLLAAHQPVVGRALLRADGKIMPFPGWRMRIAPGVLGALWVATVEQMEVAREHFGRAR